jgi:opacity protein-like surface antigen
MMKRSVALAGIALAAFFSGSSAAFAQCTATGGAGLAGFNLANFAAGGSVNSLIAAASNAETVFLTQSSAFVSAPPNPRPDQEGGGVWARGIGGDITTKNTGVATFNLGPSVFGPGGPVPGSLNCNTKTNIKFSGAQVGTDIARLNWGGWNVHVGTTAGYLSTKAADVTPGGTFGATIEMPFAGAYVLVTNGGLFIDGQLRFDYIQARANDPTNAVFNQNGDARSTAFTANIGYNFALPNNWFIEPSGGVVVSKTKVDQFNTSGTAAILQGLAPPGTVQIGDIDSTLARLSVRGGVTIPTSTVVWQPFVTASVYHEFSGAVNTSFTSNLPALGGGFAIPGAFPVINGNLTSSRVGTYEQFAVGLAGQVVDTGWLGYVRADYRTGQNIEGWSVNGGVRYQFTPDLVVNPVVGKAPSLKAPPMVVAAYNWTGFYIGANFGELNGWTDWTFPQAGTTTNPRFAGAAGGGQIGYDYQIGKWVVGIEGAFDGSNAHGSRPCPNGFFFNCEDKVDWLVTGTVKVGYAFWNRSLVYLRGGVAGGHQSFSQQCNTGIQPVVLVVLFGCGSGAAADRVGWTIGYGSEFALSQNWTVRGETNYFDLGTNNYNIAGGVSNFGSPLGAVIFQPASIKERGVISTIGLNYRFSTGGGSLAMMR